MSGREPTPQLLESLARQALARGVPEADAEDLVVGAWEQASRAWREEQGPFSALCRRVMQRRIADWWRAATRRPEVPGLPQEAHSRALGRLEEVHANQRRLLEALDEQERRVFATWALQRHLPQGRLSAREAAATLGLTEAEYNNQKKRLKRRILRLSEEWGLAPRAFFSVEEDEGPRQGVRRVG